MATTPDKMSYERRRAVDAATQVYLAGGAVDMSALATTLGVGRATLYRHVGNREELIATVLAEATERTMRRVSRSVTTTGAQRILDLVAGQMHAVDKAKPLHDFTSREPLLFVRLALMPGKIEAVSTAVLAEALTEESESGRLSLPLPVDDLALAIVRICDVNLYAPLLGGDRAEIDTALNLVALILGVERAPSH
ncbi:QsdR family transcriptional regulator [Jongsikchunia kroppenstedtii]|uniref:QsdR family transcriptional regulator n=1 Tax=Jongsikchunia kroppenstedtii TaxID=1121721 RepID=UPI0003673BA2|nr:QsdR family transcriptional regulator [Jongsikchunia kroppenstedtii]